jgi:hypothetical protein
VVLNKIETFESFDLASEVIELKAKYSKLLDVFMDLRDSLGRNRAPDIWYYDARLPLDVCNLYDAEYWDSQVKRWVGPAPIFSIDIPLKFGSTYSVEIATHDFILQELETDFALRAAGVTIKWDTRKGRLFKAFISPPHTGDIRLDFVCQKSLSPQELNPTSTDKRKLAFSFTHIKVALETSE